jgi:cytochrome c oxidase assembly protein subunit 15
LVFTFIVIIAGSVVRMTGSGMGCPDWPRCFGHLVPPTSSEELTYEPGRHFEPGQMVIWHDTLWVNEHSVTADDQFNRADWYKYPKHDYAVFNPLHTWVEYLNRLATVVYGIPIMLLSVCALLLWIRYGDQRAFLLALFTDVLIGYEVWLGKMVVDQNLKENSITLHMLGSLGIVVCLMLLVNHLSGSRPRLHVSRRLNIALLALLVLALIQMLLGTQVRESVDLVAKTGMDRSLWIDLLPIVFYVHRSFSILILGLFAWIFYQSRKDVLTDGLGLAALGVMLGLELLLGVILAYLDMPAVAQPLHLLAGAIFFALCFRSYLRSRPFTLPSQSKGEHV